MKECCNSAIFFGGISVRVMDLSWLEWRAAWKSKLHLGSGANVCDGMIQCQHFEHNDCVTFYPIAEHNQKCPSSFQGTKEFKFCLI